jgi:patatin-like phospholipase/acyl hydrolase
LCEYGAEALKPQKVLSQSVQVGSYVAKPSRNVWYRPKISKRVANDIRKQAIQQGVYGNFNTQTGIGWDPTWDVVLFANRYNSHRVQSAMSPSKKSSRQRTREDRATKLEESLGGQKELIENYYEEKVKSKVQDRSFEARYKRMTRGVGGSGGGGGR